MTGRLTRASKTGWSATIWAKMPNMVPPHLEKRGRTWATSGSTLRCQWGSLVSTADWQGCTLVTSAKQGSVCRYQHQTEGLLGCMLATLGCRQVTSGYSVERLHHGEPAR